MINIRDPPPGPIGPNWVHRKFGARPVDFLLRVGSLCNQFLAVILTADEMKDQYERAMKLHMSNKINEKNVYQLNLNLIDCIHQESSFITRVAKISV